MGSRGGRRPAVHDLRAGDVRLPDGPTAHLRTGRDAGIHHRSTATCKDGGYGGAFGFDDEGAGVLIADLPAHGSFTYSFRIPTSMPAGDWFAAAQGYEGGGPVAPGPASFHTTMGAPLSATFTVSGAPPGWADFTSIIATGAQCSSCINAGFGATPYGGPGYELLRSDGYVRTFGSVPNAAGNAGDLHLAAPIVAAAFTPGGGGYWMLGADGGIFTYGDAGFHGSATSAHPRPPWVGIAPTPDGHGYWVAEADGSVVCFGDARSHGQLGSPPAGIGVGPAAPIVGMAATPDGGGYWLVGRDGGVFSPSATPASTALRSECLRGSRWWGSPAPPTARATGCSPPTGASSPTATPPSSAPAAPEEPGTA
ncbi:MAG: hypothetical protein ACRDZQ_11135 [Acidimicrobiales bacterium]